MNNNYNCAAHKSKNLRDIFAVIIAIAAPLSHCQQWKTWTFVACQRLAFFNISDTGTTTRPITWRSRFQLLVVILYTTRVLR